MPTHKRRNSWNTIVHDLLYPGHKNKFVESENIILYNSARDGKGIVYNNSDSLIIDKIEPESKQTFTIGGDSISVELIRVTPKENAFNLSYPVSFLTCSNITDMRALFGDNLAGDRDPSCFVSRARKYLNNKYKGQP